MINNTKKILTEDAVAHTIHFINKTVRAANNQLQAKDCKTDFYVMTGNLVEQIIDSIECRNAKSALVIGDAGLQIVNRLIQEGITNITLALSRFENKECGIHGYLLDSVSYIIKSTFPNIKINIIDFKETAGMKTDLVIANFPYGAIGANLTKKVIDTIDFKEFINLLPANDYKRNTTKDLFNYQSDMIAVNNGFEDATVTTHIAKIHKTKVNSMTEDEFTVSQCIDPQLDKYFTQQLCRTLILDYKDPSGKRPDLWYLDKTLLIGWRDGANRHLPYSKEVETYKWNLEESLDKKIFISNKNRTRAANSGTYELCYFAYTFKSAIEKQNIAKFLYSEKGFKFLSKVFTAENSDGNKEKFIELALPKVDWTKPWTVEEILADYGYNQNEIDEVMDDLVNFKGMDD